MVKIDTTTKIYIGSTSTTFKDRYWNHKASFNKKQKSYRTIKLFMGTKKQKYKLQPILGKFYVKQKPNQTVIKHASSAVWKNTK